MNAGNPFLTWGSAGSSNEVAFANPFHDLATTMMPTTMKSALWWSEYIWQHAGTYRAAMERIIAYFNTELEIGGEAGDDQKKKYKEYCTNKLRVLGFLADLWRDRLAYGNGFCSIVVPFRRYLQSPRTGNMYPLETCAKQFDFHYDASTNEFIATCPTTGWRGPWRVIDKPREEQDQIILKRWNVHEIEILHDPYTDEVSYLWRIPEYYKRMIKEGNLFHLERASKQVLEAIRTDKLFRFKKDAIFHMKEPTLGGIRNMGWGLPRTLINFRQIFQVQVLRRHNEAISMDYVIPLRVITPEVRPGGSGGGGGISMADPLSVANGGDFRQNVRRMLNARRRDPAGWNILPFPVRYNLIGGDAKNLAPVELIKYTTEELLNASGVPVEFYVGSLTTQAAPVALRLFEATHRQLVLDGNAFLQWLVDGLSRIMSWKEVTCSLQRVTIADDAAKQMAALQLMMGQQLSGYSGLHALGYDWETEQKRLADEARKQMELQARQQEEVEQAGFAAQVAKAGDPKQNMMAGGQQGAQPGAQGGGQQGGAQGDQNQQQTPMPVDSYIQSMGNQSAVSPTDLNNAATQLADELLGLPESIKDSQLRRLKQFHPVLHSVTRARMDEKRNQAKQQGGAMLMQQQQQGG